MTAHYFVFFSLSLLLLPSITLLPSSSQGLLVASGEQEESTESYECVSAPAPHEPSAEVREASSHGGPGLLSREGRRELGRATDATQLDRAQSQCLNCGGAFGDEAGGGRSEERRVGKECRSRLSGYD